MPVQPEEILQFWREAGPSRWYRSDDAFDTLIRERFEAAHHAAARGELDDWLETPAGALALVILLDQFPRNLYRGSAHAFATDPLARAAARSAIARGHDQAPVAQDLREFFYLPFEHAEELAEQDRAIELFEALGKAKGDPDTAKWAQIHRIIIAQFGRFPHRNRCLGRETTAEEQGFLDGGGFSG
jgi:uncharacterized protein (DUF924 family)